MTANFRGVTTWEAAIWRRRAATLLPAATLGAAVFAACLFGIATRPIGFLATVWPANAVMLGLLIRFPAMAGAAGWLMAALAFVAADLLTGSSPLKAAILNGANLAGIGAAYWLVYARLEPEMTRLRRPESMLYLLVASATAGVFAGAVGGVANPVLFSGGVFDGFSFWLITEAVNYITILPVILTFPGASELRSAHRRLRSVSLADAAPLVALVVSCLVAALVGGHGAIAFPVPALLWCGLTYSTFLTSILTLLFGAWSLVATSFGLLPELPTQTGEAGTISLRMGICLMAIGPVMLASVMAARNELEARLHYLASHDALTGAANRVAFHARAEQSREGGRQSVAALLIDLDHFKLVNDTFGHAAGDEVLTTFARRVQACLRPADTLARLGGEEFAVLLVGCRVEAAVEVAQRIRCAIADEPIRLTDGRAVKASVSIGVAIGEPPWDLDRMLAEADRALYAAKTAGRDRVELASTL